MCIFAVVPSGSRIIVTRGAETLLPPMATVARHSGSFGFSYESGMTRSAHSQGVWRG